MKTTVTEIAERIFRFSTHVPDAGPGGFTFNQFLIEGEQPLLFDTGGHRVRCAIFASESDRRPQASLSVA
jgi:flavorubredoxin